ncbi:MAG: hypothetical protein MK101_06785 [Phycisphaerales bacterium]|nr:hypothetical protein [Phycisphaerales bacterium]
MPVQKSFFALSPLIASVALAADFPVNEGSSADINGGINVALEGNLIGDWDEETYPEGTLTQPGIWGGSGNNEIPLEMGMGVVMDFAGDVTGGMSIDLDADLGACFIDDLDWDLLGGGTATATLNMSLLYDTFHTEQPDALYIGGFPIELPLGEATVSEAIFSQAGAGAGTATEMPGAPGMWELNAVVPGMAAITLEFFENSWPLELPASLVLTGTWTQTESGAEVALSATFQVDETVDLPGEQLPPIPFELPTIVPPGDFAGVYLNLAPTSAGVQFDLNALVTAQAEEDDAIPGDANGDGVVNADDLLAVLAAWGPCEGCSEDLDGNGVVGVDEILLIIANWG